MRARLSRTAVAAVACGTGFVLALAAMSWSGAADPEEGLLRSRVVGRDDARLRENDWGRMRFFFTGQTGGTRNVLVATATVEPGQAVHRAHRHAAEEYLLLTEGSGTWSLDGKESPAKEGDILYVEPWVYHGLVNTSDRPLTFAVIRYVPKGIDPPPRPDDRPDER